MVRPVLNNHHTIFVTEWLNSDGTLERPKRFLLNVQNAKETARGLPVGLVILAVAVAVARYMDFPALNQVDCHRRSSSCA